MSKPNIDVIVNGPTGVENKHRGTTDERPTTGMLPGFQYFDTTLGKPIWWNGEQWIDALGNSVDTVYQEKVTGAEGNFAGFGEDGILTDSGSKASDFQPAEEDNVEQVNEQ